MNYENMQMFVFQISIQTFKTVHVQIQHFC